jgi:hypothetical protein
VCAWNEGKQVRAAMPIRRFLSSSALRLAVFTGISTLVVSFAVVRFYSILSRNENMSARDFAVPLAFAALLGVLFSRARHCGNISPAKTILTVAVVPFVAFCTFLAAFVIVFGLYYGHSTRILDLSLFVLALSVVVVIVRWSVHLFCGFKKLP